MKEFKFENYKSLNYKFWVLGDKAREGINIKKLGLLNKDELGLWNTAIPYQDQRDDPGQGEIVAYFTRELLKYLPGERRIAVPAGILHDIGWHNGDLNSWKKLIFLLKNQESKKILKLTDTEKIRRPHQNRGNLLAGRILEKVKWPEKYNNEIADIIGDHDTRKLPAGENGKIVRAADLFWRISYPCLQIYHKNTPINKLLEICEGTSLYMKPPRNLRKTELEIAKIEMVNSFFFKFGDKVEKALKTKYKKELDKIIEFYNK